MTTPRHRRRQPRPATAIAYRAHPMSTPRVAVCVPVYRNAAHLALTLESVLAQTFQDWELVAVDDHSDDGSFEIAQSFAARDPRITVHRNEANLGPAANWTRSVELTSAPLVKLLCGDDLLEPTCLERQVAVFDADTEHRIGVVANRRNIVDNTGAVVKRDHGLGGLPKDATRITRHDLAVALLRSGTNPLGEPSITMMRREAWATAGGFPPEWKYVIDVATNFSIAATYDIAVLHETLGSFRVSTTAWSGALKKSQASESRRFFRHVADTERLSRVLRARGAVMAQARQVGRTLVIASRRAG
jgi:glycosyltransferase involved in cell wall biosynthesis